MSAFKIVVLLGICLFLSGKAFSAESDLSEQGVVTTGVEEVGKLTKSQETHAEQWSLSVEEYKEYLQIMQSPRAYFTPNLDKNPLLALALEAKTDEEREEYADRWVQIQFDSNVKVLAWQLEVSAAWKRKFPGVPRFAYRKPGLSQHAVSNLAFSPQAKSSNNVLERLLKPKPRAQLFVSAINCEKCIKAFEQQYKALKSGDIEGVDVHFVGSPSKQTIIDWAVARRLLAADVNESRIVTLNVAEKQVSTVPMVEFAQ